MLAMHMANELLTPPVAVGFIVLAAAVLAWSSRRAQVGLDPAKVPWMGVLGAFVFAAQMINFPILPGTSGHLGGGVLLALLLGPHAATLVMTSILIIQCLIFQDGGLLALGTNVVNMGIIPCYLGFGVFRAVAGARPGGERFHVAVFVATAVGMLTGAAMVPVEVRLSGVLAVPLPAFLAVMLALHLPIALAEAVITFLVIRYLARVRPQLLAGAGMADGSVVGAARLGGPAAWALLAVAAVVLGGLISAWASRSPDALESLTDAGSGRTNRVRENPDPRVAAVTQWQERAAPLSDYQVPGWSESLGMRVSGLIGVSVTLPVVWLVGRLLLRRRTGTANPS